MRFGKLMVAGLMTLGVGAVTPAISSAAERGGARQAAPAREVRQEAPRRDAPRAQLASRDVHETTRLEVVHEAPARREEIRVRHIDRDRHDDDRARIGVVIQTPVYEPDFDTAVAIGQVPAFVMDTEARTVGGLPILSIDYIRQGGQTFYDFRVDRQPLGRQVLRISADGQFIGFE